MKRAFCDILGLRECDEPGDSISRRNFPPLPWIPQLQAIDGDMSKEERRGRPSREAGLVRDSIIQLFFFSLDSDSDSDSDLDSYLDPDFSWD